VSQNRRLPSSATTDFLIAADGSPRFAPLRNRDTSFLNLNRREAAAAKLFDMPITIELVNEPTADVRLLIGELDAELAGPYPPENRHGLSLSGIFQLNILFFIARIDSAAAGCGGIAFEENFAELKRMYVRPQYRRRGVARALVAKLEEEARARGVKSLNLETGDAQKPAIRLYESAGFIRCGAFGKYAQMPSQATQRCVFFEKVV
jgi:putative acetyltransferase